MVLAPPTYLAFFLYTCVFSLIFCSHHFLSDMFFPPSLETVERPSSVRLHPRTSIAV